MLNIKDNKYFYIVLYIRSLYFILLMKIRTAARTSLISGLPIGFRIGSSISAIRAVEIIIVKIKKEGGPHHIRSLLLYYLL